MGDLPRHKVALPAASASDFMACRYGGARRIAPARG